MTEFTSHIHGRVRNVTQGHPSLKVDTERERTQKTALLSVHMICDRDACHTHAVDRGIFSKKGESENMPMPGFVSASLHYGNNALISSHYAETQG